MAFTAVAALIAGAEVTAPLVLAAVAEVGTAISVVGLVTGNKEMVKIGGIMGIVGGVGALATGAMSAGGAAASSTAVGSDVMAPAAIDASTATSADLATNAASSSAAGDLANMGSDVYSSGADAAGLGGDVNAGLGSAGDAALGTASGFAPSDAGTQVSLESTAPADTSVAGQTAAAQPMQAAPSVTTPAGTTGPANVTGTTPGITNPTDARLAAGTQGTPMNSAAGVQAAPLDSNSYLQKLLSYAQDPKNKTVMELGAKLVGGAMQGAQQQSQFNQKLDLENRRLAQTGYASQVAQNRPHGIIQGARK